jgi:hypothetical protein
VPLSDDDLFAELAELGATAREARLASLCAGDAEQEARLRDQLDLAAPDGFRFPSELPARLGPFKLLAEIDRGAHGVVYRAERADLEGEVAVKVIAGAARSARVAEWARREGGFARRVRSPHVVQVHDVGRLTGGACYVEMELCADTARGGAKLGANLATLGATAAGTPLLSFTEAVQFVEQAALGVQAAHDAGVVHGDIKPQNVVVTPDTRRAQLADFGIATSLASAGEALGPDRRVRIGTVAYMAPEQFMEGRRPDEASDVYMLGGTLLFLLAGRPPHPERRIGPGELHDGLRTPLPASVPVRLREIVERCLAPEPRDRYPSAGVLAEQLRRFRALEPTLEDRSRPVRRAALFARRKSEAIAAVAAVAAIAAVAVYAVWLGLTAEVRRTRDDAQQKAAAAREELRDLEGKKTGVERSAVDLERSVARLEGRRQELEKELKKADEELPRVRDANQRLAVELRAAQDVAVAAERKATDAERHAREVGDAKAAETVVVREQLAAARHEAAEAREAQTSTAAALGEVRGELQRLGADRQAQDARLVQQARAIEALSSRVGELAAAVERLRAKQAAASPPPAPAAAPKP